MVVDGDTIRFSNSRNRLTDNYQVIRLLGVQSPEKLSGASGCEGVVAHEFLRNAIEGRPVVLASSSDSRSSIRNRRLRTVYVKQDDGTWIDASVLMLNAGLGQWMPKKYEPVTTSSTASCSTPRVPVASECGTRPSAARALTRTCDW